MVEVVSAPARRDAFEPALDGANRRWRRHVRLEHLVRDLRLMENLRSYEVVEPIPDEATLKFLEELARPEFLIEVEAVAVLD